MPVHILNIEQIFLKTYIVQPDQLVGNRVRSDFAFKVDIIPWQQQDSSPSPPLIIIIVHLFGGCLDPARLPDAKRLEACLWQVFLSKWEIQKDDVFDSQSTLISHVSSRLSSIAPSASTLWCWCYDRVWQNIFCFNLDDIILGDLHVR